ncbi:MAG: sulfatase family protein [Planctomycetota bacterium]
MNRRNSVKTSALLACATIACGLSTAVPANGEERIASSRPNIVVILCDDLGYGDLSCYGHPIIKTPNLDRLAYGGIRFTDGYAAAPVCSPSRAGMLTGRNPYRAGIYDWIAGGAMHLRKSEVTFPALLQRAGYDTVLGGKWHLSGRFNRPEQQPTPGDHGFDYWFATANNASPNHRNPRNFVRNGKAVGNTEGYSSSLVVKETLNWLDNRKDKTKAFLSVLTFHEPHTPVASPEELIEEYKPYEKVPGQAIYRANVAQVDRAVGTFVEGLKSRQLYENTLVVFTSDNGPEEWMRYPACNLQHGSTGALDGKKLRGYKLDVFEGGIRVPLIVNWPAVIKHGRTSREAISSLDFLPTFCRLGQAEIPDGLKLDGCDISLLIKEGKPIKREKPLFWFYYRCRGYANMAMRDGDYLMIARRTEELFYPGMPYNHQKHFPAVVSSRPRSHELYDIKNDPGELFNLARTEKQIFEQMRKRMDEYLEDVQQDCPDWGEN